MGHSAIFRPEIKLELMNDACKLLIGRQNFESFSRVKTEVNNFYCNIMEVHWTQEKDKLVFYIKANRFLRGMVRAIVGTMLDIGTERITSEDFQKIIEGKDRKLAGQAAPPEGLFLNEVVYDECLM